MPGPVPGSIEYSSLAPTRATGDRRDDGSRAGFDNDFTQRTAALMTWNPLHLARVLKDAGGIPAYGNR